MVKIFFNNKLHLVGFSRLVINDTIQDNICLPSLENIKRKHILHAKDEKAFADRETAMIVK